jgi:hypothetical protein
MGSVLFLAGIIIAFMVVHERIWISLEKVPTGLTIKVAQRSNGRPTTISGRLLKHLESLAGMKS